ncbi:MAG: hypothetical protein KJ061_00110 [Vicinamibacteraceae bacterium]|nr:hypothetical protein [Vicinamibacteraceae bacterium]
MDKPLVPEVPLTAHATSRKASAVAGLMLLGTLAALVSYWPLPSTPLPDSPASLARSPLPRGAHVEPPSPMALAWWPEPRAHPRAVRAGRTPGAPTARPVAHGTREGGVVLTASWTPGPASLPMPPAPWSLPEHRRAPFEHVGATLARGAAEAGHAFSRSGRAIRDVFR